jgi:Holliday junction DNA helicase RuvA
VIASVRGTVERIGPGEVVVDVGGVGLRLSVTAGVLQQAPQVGQPIYLHTATIVREDAISLFGFQSMEERQLFDLLLQVSGIGPRLALSILSNLSPELLRSAVAQAQPEILTRVPGIGRKSADKIVFELKDKLEAPALAGFPPPSGADTEVLQALTALGYSVVEAQAALQSVPTDAPEAVEERVRLALQHFSRP